MEAAEASLFWPKSSAVNFKELPDSCSRERLLTLPPVKGQFLIDCPSFMFKLTVRALAPRFELEKGSATGDIMW